MTRKGNKSGAIMLMTALLSTAIIGITAIVVDIGYLYFKRNELQTTVNAGWLAGNDRLMKLRTINPVLTQENQDEIRNHIIEVMSFNGFQQDSDNSLSVTIKDNRDIELVAQSHVGLFFARMIKADSTTISAGRDATIPTASTADILPITMSHGVIKWNQENKLSFQFFPKDSGFIEGQEYIIKPGQISENSILCQGITGFGHNINVDQYQKILSYGYTKTLNINDKVTLGCMGYTNETENILNSREASKRVIIPIVEPTAETASIYGTTPNMLPIYSLKQSENANRENNPLIIPNAARIIGFAEFELLKTSEYTRIGNNYENGDAGSLGAPTSGQIRGKFISYIVNPHEISNL